MMFRIIVLSYLLLTGLKVSAQAPRLVMPIGHAGIINNVVYAPNGRIILTAAGNQGQVWDAFTGKLLYNLNGHTKNIAVAKFSSDGKIILTAASDATFRLYSAGTGKLIKSIQVPGRDPFILDASFSPDGRKVLTITRNTFTLWDIEEGKSVYHSGGHKGNILTIAFSERGQHILTSSVDSTAKIWDARNGALLHDLRGHTHQLKNALFSPDGLRAATLSFDTSVKVWDTRTGSLLSTLKGHVDHIYSMAFSPESNLILTTSADKTIKLWDVPSGKLLSTLEGHLARIKYASFSPDAQTIVSVSSDSTARIWDVKGKLLRTIKEGGDEFMFAASFSPKGDHFFTASFRKINIWHTKSGGFLTELKGHSSLLEGATYSPDESLLITNARSGAIQIWDVLSGSLLQTLKQKVTDANTIRLSSDNNWLAAISTRKLFLFNARSGALLWEVEDIDVCQLEFSPDSKRLLVCIIGGYPLRIYNCLTGIKELELTGYSPKYASFSPDGSKILMASYRANVIDAYTGSSLFPLPHFENLVAAFYSGDGKKIITVAPDSAKIWNAGTGGLLVSVGSTKQLIGAALSSDGTRLLAFTNDGYIYTWHTDTGTGLLTVDNSQGTSISSTHFSRDGANIIINYSSQWSSYSQILVRNAVDGKIVLEVKGSKKMDAIRDKFIGIEDSELRIMNPKNGMTSVSLFSLDSADYLTQLPSKHYLATPDASKLLHYVTPDLKVISFEQLDVKYNRPDLVLAALGNRDTALIQSYRKAYEKRIRKLGIDTASFGEGFGLPQTDILNRESISYEQTGDRLTLQIKGKDSSYRLDRFNLWVNEVPLYGLRGISLRDRRGNNFDTTITLTLSSGKNIIETSITNVNGTESYRMPLQVAYAPKEKATEKTYFIGIGINNFKEPGHRLQWSVKDIKDLSDNVRKKYGASAEIITLYDEAVTVENILALKKKLLQASVNDKVIISYSGHGLLSESYDYYLSTYGVNFKKPEEGGLPYEALEALLDSIPARKKLMLIDACHSGEVDKDEMQNYAKAGVKTDGSRGGGVINVSPDAKLGMKNSFELMQELFVNVGRSTGATIISAAGGTQLAREGGGFQNGYFTHAILELMKKDSVTVSELKAYVNKRVSELSQGLQQPTTRTETKAVDWTVW